ncbi:MAG TPA: hypothetical protein VHA57_05955 [Actinomycetota bacterium]|nr:hypothetical protein [Actinomycetota bacterium]
MNKTGSWSARAGLLVVAGVLTAGCTLGHTASAPKAPASAGPTSAGSVPAQPGSTQAPPAAPATPSSSYATAEDLQAEAQDQAALDQALNDLQNELTTSDAALSGGENDVPTN